ncbi:NDUFB7 (predicted) [Pycnogonum litorale]
MGQIYTRSWVVNIKEPDLYPDKTKDPTFDPLHGFPNGRKERVMIASEEDMRLARIPLKDRDYCAHMLLDYQRCRLKEFPLLYRCGHEKHEYSHCKYDDYVLRMKEYERERRLIVRAKRKNAETKAENLEE